MLRVIEYYIEMIDVNDLLIRIVRKFNCTFFYCYSNMIQLRLPKIIDHEKFIYLGEIYFRYGENRIIIIYNFELLIRRKLMFIDNLDKIIGMVGLVMGIELIAIAIFSVSVLYFRNPVVSGVIGNLSSLGMLLGTLFVFVKKDMQ